MKTPPSLEDSAAEPVKYTGADQTDKRFHHGRLRHDVGVHRYQAFRADRTGPDEEGETDWTYNHQPYLAWWHDRFYLQYLSNLVEEHKPPGRTLLCDRLMTLQWWEEDRGEDGFYPEGMGDKLIALSSYQRPDGVTVALWKRQFAALSPDVEETFDNLGSEAELDNTGPAQGGTEAGPDHPAGLAPDSNLIRCRKPILRSLR